MAETLSSYNRDRTVHSGAADVTVLPGDHRHNCRYYATQRRRPHRYSSFSIMNWFRRSKRYDDADGDDGDDGDGNIDSAWFRDDLKRIQQAYQEHEPDYAVVTPIAQRRRKSTTAATWSRWSGSTTTVYSFAYVDGVRHQGDDDHRQLDAPSSAVDDVVEYIDAATLPVSRWRSDHGQYASSATGKKLLYKKPSPTATTSGYTITATARRRYKRAAPPPPVTIDRPSSFSPSTDTAKTPEQRRTATMARKKYKAPQPPKTAANANEAMATEIPQQQLGCRNVKPHRYNKGPAPKPPVGRFAKPDKLAAIVLSGTDDVDGGRLRCSNVRRKITQYEKDRLMERVDKIEKHFLRREKNVVTSTAAAAVQERGEKSKQITITTTNNGFASVAALYTAMAVTNLTELDKRAAEICRQNRLKTASSAVTDMGIISSSSGTVTTTSSSAPPIAAVVVPRQPAVITIDHKNAIVAAVIRKSYPATVAGVKTATHGNTPVLGGNRGTSGGTYPTFTNITTVSGKTMASVKTKAKSDKTAIGKDKTVEDNEKRLVRHKRLEFFQQRLVGTRQTDDGSDCVNNGHGTATGSSSVAVKSSLGTQTAGSVVVTKIPLTSSNSFGYRAAVDTSIKSGGERLTGEAPRNAYAKYLS